MTRRERIESVVENPNDYDLAYPNRDEWNLTDDMYAELQYLYEVLETAEEHMKTHNNSKAFSSWTAQTLYEAVEDYNNNKYKKEFRNKE